MIRFDAIKVPFTQLRENNYFSDSVLDRLYDSIINFITTTQGAASIVHESTVDVVKVKNLMNYLTTSEGEKNIKKRFALAKLLKSFNNMMLLDTEEDYTQQNQTFAGLPDLIDRYAKMLSAATDIPATRFLGTSASGLNATGEGDLKNYYDMVKSLQETDYGPKLDYFDQIMLASLQFELPEDTDLSYEFNSLFQMTPKEQAEVDNLNATTMQTYYDMDVLTSSMIAKELKQKNTFLNITDEHIAELEEFEDIDDGLVTDPEDFTGEPEEQDENGEEETSESSEES